MSGWRQVGWGVLGAVLGVVFWVSPLNPVPNKDFGLGQSAGKSITVDELFREKRSATVRLEQRSSVLQLDPDSIGTGFIISPDGYVLTAYHVIQRGGRLSAVSPSRERFAVNVVGFDAIADLALLKITSSKALPFVPLTERKPRVGENVLAIGNSSGDFLQPRAGRLLRLKVSASRPDFPQNTLELDAPIGPGDSGGPILNGDGEALGVVSYIRLDTDGNLLGGYAVPVDSASDSVREMKAGIKRDAPVIGFKSIPHALDQATQRRLGIRTDDGVVVGTVPPGTPAARAGLQVYDVILRVNGEATPDITDVQRKVRTLRVGDVVRVEVRRGERVLQLLVTLAAKEQIFPDP